MTITRDQVLDALRAQLAKGIADVNALAESLGATPKAVRMHLMRARNDGLVTYEPRDMTTLAFVGERRARPAKPKPATIAEVAERHAEPTPAPAADRWTAGDMRALLDVPRAAVTLVRRALATPWGPALLDAIASLADEPAPVRVVAPSAPRVARAKATPEPEEAPPTKTARGSFRVIDADGDVVRTCRTLSAAKAAMAEDDADHVLDADDQIVARGGVDEDEDEEG